MLITLRYVKNTLSIWYGSVENCSFKRRIIYNFPEKDIQRDKEIEGERERQRQRKKHITFHSMICGGFFFFAGVFLFWFYSWIN